MMRQRLTYSVLMLASVCAIASAAARPAVAATREACLSDWAEASALVTERNMIDVAGLTRLAQEKFEGRIMTARLCRGEDGYFYRIVIRGDDGRVQQLKVDAKAPAKP